MNSTYWLNKIMSVMYTENDAFYIGLSSTPPNSNGTNITEPVGQGYSRVAVDGFSEPDGGVVRNTKPITFPRSTGIWFDATDKAKYWVLFDGADSNANFLSSGLLDEEKTIESNTTVTIAERTLSVTLADFQSATN